MILILMTVTAQTRQRCFKEAACLSPVNGRSALERVKPLCKINAWKSSMEAPPVTSFHNFVDASAVADSVAVDSVADVAYVAVVF